VAKYKVLGSIKGQKVGDVIELSGETAAALVAAGTIKAAGKDKKEDK